MYAEIVASAALLFFRLLPLLVVAPIMAFNRLPPLARVVLTVSLAFVLAPTAPAASSALTWATLAREFLLGMALAFGFHAAIGAAHTFGHVLDQQVGFAAAVLFDPTTDQAASVIAELMQLIVMVGFFALDGHHSVLRGFSALLEAVPPGARFELGGGLIAQLGIQFGLGLTLVAPLLVLMWLLDLALALVSRAAPQANVYFVAIPLKLGVALLALAWLCGRVLPVISQMLRGAIHGWSESVG